MTGILRTWRCQSKYCGQAFDSWENYPHCPACRCIRTEWMPAGGHIGGYSRNADKELKALADVFGLTDLNSGERGRGAKKVNLPEAEGWPSRHQPVSSVKNFGGFAAAVDPIRNVGNGYNGAQCVPTANTVKYKVKAAPGRALPRGPTPGPTPAIEYSHKGPGK